MWPATYLNLQDIITANALVVHVVVRVIRIAAIFVFHERKPVDFRSAPVARPEEQ
jgi:hypothetical protein